MNWHSDLIVRRFHEWKKIGGEFRRAFDDAESAKKNFRLSLARPLEVSVAELVAVSELPSCDVTYQSQSGPFEPLTGTDLELSYENEERAPTYSKLETPKINAIFI